MKWMKVIDNKQSMMNKEFEHDEELQLMWDKNRNQMHLIQCVSIRNLSQMKSMKVICNMKSMMNKEFEYDEEWKYSTRCQNIESISFSMSPKWTLIE
jgi:hypothetical protein